MTSYLLVESGAALDRRDADAFVGLAARLSDARHEVTLFLLGNAVLLALEGVAGAVADLAGRQKTTVWVDELSLRSRVADPDRLAGGVQVGGMPELVRLLMRPGSVPVWH